MSGVFESRGLEGVGGLCEGRISCGARHLSVTTLDLMTEFVRYEPEALFAKYQAIRHSVSVEVFYTNPRYRKAMEFWCAATFALGYAQNVASCAVWVPEGKQEMYYDFELEVRGERRKFELTEVQTEGRRRGDEYRAGKTSLSSTRDEWDHGERFGPQWVAAAVARKYEHYRGDVSAIDLLVYVNYLAPEHPYQKLREKAPASAGEFRSVWLLNGNAIACIAGRDEAAVMQKAWMFFTREEEE